MRELYEIISGSAFLFGYHVPIVFLIAGALGAISLLWRSTWPGLAGVLLVVFSYVVPAP